jgi:hypothetical protein
VRRFVATAMCLAVLSTVAHAQALLPMIMPSPLGIVLTVGKWVWDATNKEQVYYIEVAGEGRTTEEARTVAFRVAIEQAIGSLVSSETEVQNSRIVRDEIISYASGYVDRYEIIKQEASVVGVRVTMKVWVRRSALSNRLLNRSEKSGEVDGPRASVQLSTLNQERATGDRLVQTVLNDFPKRAFDIDLKNTELKYSDSRQGFLEVPFRLSWNKDYLTSLWTALNATSQKSSRPVATVIVSPGAWLAGFGGSATYDDTAKLQLIAGSMVGSRPAVLITVKSAANTVLFRQCFRWPELDHIDGYVVREGRFVRISPYGNSIAINGGFKLNAVAQIPANPALLANASQIDADVVNSLKCPNQ